MSIKFYKDSQNYPRVNAPKSMEVLGWFLEQDIQRSMSSCDEIIQIVESIQQSKLNIWKGTGNAHTITITSESVTITNEFSDDTDSCLLTIVEFKNAIVLWREFIEN